MLFNAFTMPAISSLLKQVPTRAYLFTAVRHAALRRFIRYWSRTVLSPTMDEIASAERCWRVTSRRTSWQSEGPEPSIR